MEEMVVVEEGDGGDGGGGHSCPVLPWFVTVPFGHP